MIKRPFSWTPFNQIAPRTDFTGYNLETFAQGEEIRQALYFDNGGVRQRIYENVMRTADQDIRNALIKLGWTPPKDV